jgi:hypothetical protein
LINQRKHIINDKMESTWPQCSWSATLCIHTRWKRLERKSPWHSGMK